MKLKHNDGLSTLQTMLPFKADNLTSKLTKLSLAVAFLLGLIVGTAQVMLDYHEQKNQLNSDINNILRAAEKPAKEAAYNLNKNVAAIVIDGLMQYSFIDNAVITDNFGEVLASGIEVPDIDSFTRSISSYLFDIDKEYTIDLPGDDRDPLYGQLSIIVDKHKAMDDLYERSLFILFSGLLRNLILGAILAAVFYIVLTRPIVKVAEEIRKKNLTKNEKPGFTIPAELADNEIGALLTTFNQFVLGVKDADNFLRTVLDSSPTAMIISNISNGMILYANPVAQTMLGRTDAELVGSMIKDFYVKMDDQELLFEIQEKNVEIKDREPLKKQELFAKHKDGTKICIDASIQLIEYEGNKVLISTFFDLTERKKAEDEKEKLESLLRQSHKMESIGILAGGVAHDFNNLLYMIMGNTELALEDIPEWNPVHENLKEVKEASLRAAGVVKQLLNFSRKTDQNLKPIGVVTVIKDALKFLRSTISSIVKIQTNLPDTDVPIQGDPIQINQIMMNLCTNAFQVMQNTGGIIKVDLEIVRLNEEDCEDYTNLSTGNHIKIMVRDTGPGIAPDILDKIFDPYFTTKEFGAGSGMGLSVVHGIVKNHNGVIYVDSNPGQGATFNILFPVIDELLEPTIETKEKISHGTEAILIVDDEESIANMTRKMLERLGYQIEKKLNPIEALELFKAKPDSFDLVITDMAMPQMTGVNFADKLKEIRPDIPVIICTGNSAVIDQKKSKLIGIDGFVMKPVSKLKIAKAIRDVLDKE